MRSKAAAMRVQKKSARKMPPVADATDASTRRRLLEVAGETFGERGFRQTTIRAIVKRAGVNIAAVHYHFGSKEQLYLAALREALERGNEAQPPRPDPPLDARDLPRFLKFFVRNAIDRLLAPRPDWHMKLLQREFMEPSFALDIVVKEFIRPQFDFLHLCVGRVLPGARKREQELYALSIISQIVYYRCAGPIALRLLGEKSFDAKFLGELAEHVTVFSTRGLGGRA